MTAPRVRMSDISRRFGAVTALDGASLELAAGEVHGVLGENGAGKTTLLGVLAGMVAPDRGTVEIDGRAVTVSTPRDAWRHGVGMVHQHFKLVAELTALENLSLGLRAERHGLALPYARVRRRVRELEERTGLRVALDRRVGALGVGERQRVEILKALLRNPRVLILDEPTAVLTPDEVASLFELLRSLARDGTSVALVAHKLDEVMAVSDRYTVLRNGRSVLEGAGPDTDTATLVRAMVGEAAAGWVWGRHAPDVDAEERVSGKRAAGAGEVVAHLRDVSVYHRAGPAVRDATLEVRRGEIVGIAGVEGNGQRELALVLARRIEPDVGRAELPPGIGFVPQDRTTEGLVADFDLTENVGLAWHEGHGLMPWDVVRERAEEIRRRFDVRAPSVRTRAGALSGGNQQRLVVGRELGVARDLLVAENPTRGLDIAATAFVRGSLARLAADKRPVSPGVVLISSDLDEVLELSDRVFVMVRGRLRRVHDAEMTRERVGALMLTGGS